MTTILMRCPSLECGERHAATWLVKKGGRRLGVVCTFGCGAGHSVFRGFSDDVMAGIDRRDFADCPEYYTPAAKEKKITENNLQLVMMNPTETVERNVDLSWKPKAESDAEKANKLQAQIQQCLDAQKDITKQIEKLDGQRRFFEKEERELRSQLRAVWTMPLELKAE